MTKENGLKFGEGTLRERHTATGEVRWQCRWWDALHGETIQRAKTFPTRDEAEDHLRAIFRAKQANAYTLPSQMTVSDLVREYIARAGARISERTTLSYQQRAASMIDPTIGARKLESLTPLDLQRWIDRLGKDGFRPSTIHGAVAVLMGALREAALLGITDRHLGTGIRRPTIRRTERTTWTETEVKRVLKAVSGDDRFDALYHVAIATGMRPGELRALQWADVDLDHGVIRVRRTITRGEDGHEISVLRTKAGPGRAVALAPPIVEKLRWHRARQRERQIAHEQWQKQDVVFDRGDGHWLYGSQWHRYQVELCARAGVPVIRLHDLRHSFATLMMKRGVHPKVVSDILGHAQISLTLDLYSHVDSSLQRTAVEGMGDLWFEGKAAEG